MLTDTNCGTADHRHADPPDARRASGLFLAASPWHFGFADYVWIPHVAFGLLEVGASLMTQTQPGYAAQTTKRGVDVNGPGQGRTTAIDVPNAPARGGPCEAMLAPASRSDGRGLGLGPSLAARLDVALYFGMRCQRKPGSL